MVRPWSPPLAGVRQGLWLCYCFWAGRSLLLLPARSFCSIVPDHALKLLLPATNPTCHNCECSTLHNTGVICYSEQKSCFSRHGRYCWGSPATAAGVFPDHVPELLLPSTTPTCCCWSMMHPCSPPLTVVRQGRWRLSWGHSSSDPRWWYLGHANSLMTKAPGRPKGSYMRPKVVDG